MKTGLIFLLFAVTFSLVFCADAKANDSRSAKLAKTSTGGIIKGRLLNGAGKPCPHTELELIPVNAKKISKDERIWTVTNGNGYFDFENVPDGKYTLSINFDETPTDISPYSTYFYPNAPRRSNAKVFDITKTSNFSRLLFRLPASYEMKRFTGKIVWEDGEPVEYALVSLVDLDAQSDTGFGKIKSDANGTFKVSGFVGRKYQIAAILFDGDLIKDENPQLLAQGFSKTFYLNPKTNIIKITLKRPGADKEIKAGLVGSLISK